MTKETKKFKVKVKGDNGEIEDMIIEGESLEDTISEFNKQHINFHVVGANESKFPYIIIEEGNYFVYFGSDMFCNKFFQTTSHLKGICQKCKN